jgi:RNA polymerase sigma-70 factor (ECF subfamily)
MDNLAAQMRALDDPALVREIQHGNETAMEEFYHRFAAGLYAFIRRRVGEPEDIEDVLAETMMAAITAIIRFKGQSQVFTWLCRIAGFKIADHYRCYGDKKTMPLDEAITVANTTEKDLETNLMIRQALLRLNREYRRVLEEKYLSGFSIREIAFHLERSEKAVESILVRARQAFAREYRRLAPEMEV